MAALHDGPPKRRAAPPPQRRQDGAFALLYAATLFVILGVSGLALDLGMLYNRQAELQGVARAAALAAARELNGTAAGIDAALAGSARVLADWKVGYGKPLAWRAEALSFSSSPNAGARWGGADAARAAPAAQFFVRVDTRLLDRDAWTVAAFVMPLLSPALDSMRAGASAVAGRSTVNVVPLAVCAMSPLPGAAREHGGKPAELVEYGFRRGVSYDLMRLNPQGATPANFVVDPVSPPGGLGAAGNTTAATVAPFVCSGSMWVARVTGGRIRVSSPFPLKSLVRELNSRFDQYRGSCDPHGAPPDRNIKSYAVPGWMQPAPAAASAASLAEGARLHTVADARKPPANIQPGMYGPLWSYASAVKHAGYLEGQPEPAAGYQAFSPAEWSGLYPSGPQASSYPARPPYFASAGPAYEAPAAARRALTTPGRRLLLVPLLECPVPPGANVGAKALAVGKFFMTAPATDTSIHAEFAGVATETTLSGQVNLYP